MNTAARKIPHIKMTPTLSAAISAIPTTLCPNPGDVSALRTKLQGCAQWFEDPAFFGHGEAQPQAEIAACDSLILLTTALREHLKAGNT